jgi:tetratricopeptide (TPR) repeat protein
MNFQKLNNIVGWAIFTVALGTYWLTVEETGSYWDCGEFIAASYKLMVPHPPGAPFFLLLGRMFSFLAMGDASQVGFWINMLSVISSAFTILFLFWSITLFGRKMMGTTTEKLSDGQNWVLMGAGAIGALAYTFSDSFWFSAVEAEVYAMSSFFTAFVVWGILKWDAMEDESQANRWLILMFYMMGLSIGVHMLNLVTLPAVGLIYYFKKYKPSFWGIILTLGISGFLVVLISEIIVPGLPSIAGKFELWFVNNLGMFFGSGALVFLLIIVGFLTWGIRYTHRTNQPIFNTMLLAISFVLIGYGSYAMVIIRSNYETPINENAPKDIMSFVRYLKREQYGTRPLLYGPYYTSQVVGYEFGAPAYKKGKEKYEPAERSFTYQYDEEHFLPRAWNDDHVESYRDIIGLKEGEKPTFAQNIAFMFKHQIGVMYGRYFMWNFVGRESDEQGADWLGPNQWFQKLPGVLAENHGRNNFFMIPFLLGFIGMYFQLVKDSKNFLVIALLFVMTGVAIVVYLNSPPVEPRERDYIYAGSYYAFAMWIGMAVIGLAELFNTIFKNLRTSAVVATLICIPAPALMAQQGWDDHNRRNRFFSVDSASNYLNSCAPNAILFTGGDNDTFPLWYAQDVEGIRTDVRVLVLSYYNTDWYIEQSMKKYYESDGLPYTLSLNDYRQGGPNDGLRFQDLKLPAVDLKDYLNLLKQSNKLEVDGANIIPSKVLVLRVDTAAVLAKGIIPKELEHLVTSEMVIRVKGNYLYKGDLALLDVLATSNWERPIYLNNTSMSQIKMDLSPYVVQEGNAYRILPIRNPKPSKELVSTEVAFENVTKKFKFREMNNPKVYYTNDYRGFVLNHRSTLNAIAEALINEGKMEKAREAIMLSVNSMPDTAVRMDPSYVGIGQDQGVIELLFRVGEKERAIELAKKLGDRAMEVTNYYLSNSQSYSDDNRKNLYYLGEIQNILYRYGEEELAKKYEEAYDSALKNMQVNEGLTPSDR